MVFKRLTALYALIFLLILSGCENINSTKGLVLSDFSADFSAEYRELEIKGSLSCAGRGLSRLELNSPKTLDGLSAEFRGGEVELNRESLLCTVDEAFVPQDSFFRLTNEVIRALPDSQPDSELQCGITLFGSQCRLCFNPDGTLLSADCPEKDFSLRLDKVEQA